MRGFKHPILSVGISTAVISLVLPASNARAQVWQPVPQHYARSYYLTPIDPLMQRLIDAEISAHENALSSNDDSVTEEEYRTKEAQIHSIIQRLRVGVPVSRHEIVMTLREPQTSW
jgi:hypothetical protein